jgi:tungstate transport system substrate-binding protein
MDAHDSTNFPGWPWDGLIPLFQQQSGYQVKAVYVGTGAAITTGQQGNADVVLVHAPASEVAFVAAGWGINRTLVMHNDFIIVGPAGDPAGIKGQTSAVAALKKIADAKATFYSRGDNSGTDQLEK